MLAIDSSLEEAAAQGQSFFASSGDTGASCAVLPTNGVPDGGVVGDTNYPASGTWTTGVGGTTLLAGSDGSYQNEIAWYGGGGGVSVLEYPGSWTADANPVYPAGSAVGAGRGTPDIAMDADPNTGANIIVNGAPLTVGGTSLSSPLALGGWARIESAHRNRIGSASLAIYAVYNRANPAVTSRTATPGFHDIVLGTNGGYAATPGYDFTTGIGTLDVAALSHQLR
jgi:pseudomonalisin